MAVLHAELVEAAGVEAVLDDVDLGGEHGVPDGDGGRGHGRLRVEHVDGDRVGEGDVGELQLGLVLNPQLVPGAGKKYLMVTKIFQPITETRTWSP